MSRKSPATSNAPAASNGTLMKPTNSTTSTQPTNAPNAAGAPSDTAALTAAPANALLIWTDNLSLYTQLPGPDGRPIVIRYPLTTAGLSQVLGIIRTRAYDSAAEGRWYGSGSNIPPGPGTPAQRENAREVLKRMGMLP